MDALPARLCLIYLHLRSPSTPPPPSPPDDSVVALHAIHAAVEAFCSMLCEGTRQTYAFVAVDPSSPREGADHAAWHAARAPAPLDTSPHHDVHVCDARTHATPRHAPSRLKPTPPLLQPAAGQPTPKPNQTTRHAKHDATRPRHEPPRVPFLHSTPRARGASSRREKKKNSSRFSLFRCSSSSRCPPRPPERRGAGHVSPHPPTRTQRDSASAIRIVVVVSSRVRDETDRARMSPACLAGGYDSVALPCHHVCAPTPYPPKQHRRCIPTAKTTAKFSGGRCGRLTPPRLAVHSNARTRTRTADPTAAPSCPNSADLGRDAILARVQSPTQEVASFLETHHLTTTRAPFHPISSSSRSRRLRFDSSPRRRTFQTTSLYISPPPPAISPHSRNPSQPTTFSNNAKQ
ncbi:hypothetical protein DAI22_03g388950 [Oryza sativa Japonica Group]|nr:hypothetical protein DAI22_03g388950 [Oryza sativa Japonica Group]